MKIAENYKNTVSFRDLEDGDVLQSGGEMFMKTERVVVGEHSKNAVNLTSGKLVFFMEYKRVRYVKAALVVDG